MYSAEDWRLVRFMHRAGGADKCVVLYYVNRILGATLELESADHSIRRECNEFDRTALREWEVEGGDGGIVTGGGGGERGSPKYGMEKHNRHKDQEQQNSCWLLRAAPWSAFGVDVISPREIQTLLLARACKTPQYSEQRGTLLRPLSVLFSPPGLSRSTRLLFF